MRSERDIDRPNAAWGEAVDWLEMPIEHQIESADARFVDPSYEHAFGK